ncbi:unnamed protein product [Rhizophagus irregularis]|nr:unnamed protein product [Rhizophagus irregularis]CAB5369093.1 unnamed protein product [Rhizophagus irregularis]
MSHLLHHDAIFTQTRKTPYLTHTLHSHTLVWFSLRLSLGLSYLCLGLLVIRSPLRPFFFTSLFRYAGSVGWECRFILSLSRSSRY